MYPINQLVSGRFGHFVLASYRGYITWSWMAGDVQEHVTLRLQEGGFSLCDVSYVSPEGAWTANGQGLLEFSMGLDPDDGQPGKPGSMYSIRGACPHARTAQTLPADWRHSFDTYKQPGGAYRTKPAQKGFLLTGLPRELKGGYRITEGEENISMAWRFCLGVDVKCDPKLLPATPP